MTARCTSLDSGITANLKASNINRIKIQVKYTEPSQLTALFATVLINQPFEIIGRINPTQGSFLCIFKRGVYWTNLLACRFCAKCGFKMIWIKVWRNVNEGSFNKLVRRFI